MQQLILVVHVLSCLGIIGLVLLQQGKGADMGAAFGSGASNTVFGSEGSSSFLLKITGLALIIFFTTSLTLTYFSTLDAKKARSQQLPVQSEQSWLPDFDEKTDTDTEKSKQDIDSPI